MKLNEKIMKLRKENAWSQEEFANKLNVSRQTVSKWELGQTIPDTDNLTKIASIFEISVNDLLDDNVNSVENKFKTNSNINNNDNNNQIKIWILIIILIFVILGIGTITLNKVFNKVTNQVVPKSISEMFQQYSFADIFDMIVNKIKESNEEFDISSFNGSFETLYYGSVDKFFMNKFIDEVLKSNNEHQNNLITIKYKDFESNNATEIRTLKEQITNDIIKTYEVYYEYDEKGYINKAIIEDGEKKDSNSQLTDFLNNSNEQMTNFQKDSFNTTFLTLYFGSTDGFFMKNFIDEIIKSNEEHPEHIITVNYAGTETSDANELRNIKNNFSNSTSYEIIYEYDENGLINKAKIKQ